MASALDPYASTSPSATALDSDYWAEIDRLRNESLRALPPQDVVERSPGYIGSRLTKEGLGERLGEQAAGIYGAPKSAPAGDVVLPSPSTTALGGSYNTAQSTVNPHTGWRYVDDLYLRNKTGGVVGGEDFTKFSENPAYGDLMIDEMRERSIQGPQPLIRTDTPTPTSELTRASYAGDVLSPYARGNAQLGQPSSVAGVKDEMARRFHTMVEAMPPEVKARVDIISGHRDAARQAQVNPSVKNSRHMHGMALDLGNDPVVLDWIGKNPQYGLGFPLRHMGPKEYNHLEMIDPKTGARASVGDEHLHEQTGSSTPPPQQQQQAAPAAGGDQSKTPKKPLHPIEIFEDAVKEYPVIHKQGLFAGPGESTEYWPAGEPGTAARPRPAFIPIDQPGMEVGPDARPIDVLGDVVSHHMVKSDPVIKKHYEDFAASLNPTQKELLQAQYMYYTKNEGETRPYDQWEKNTGLPAYFRGYAFDQWPADFNKTAYTPQQRYRLDRMMNYLRGNQRLPPAALQ